MKNVFYLLAIVILFISCNVSKETTKLKNEKVQLKEGDTIKISGDKLKYDVIIIEAGFGSYLASTAKPEGFYSKNYLENKNIRYVQEWNRRVLQPSQYNANLYEMEINYIQGTDYGSFPLNGSAQALRNIANLQACQ